MVILIVAILWVTQPPHLRDKDMYAVLTIIACVKVMYFLDGQRSMNFVTEEDLLNVKNMIRSEHTLTQAVPLLLCFFLENKIARHYRLGLVHKLICHGLTVMLFANYAITYVMRPAFPEKMTPKAMAAE